MSLTIITNVGNICQCSDSELSRTTSTNHIFYSLSLYRVTNQVLVNVITDVLGGKSSTAVSQQLLVELRIAEREMDLLDPRTQVPFRMFVIFFPSKPLFYHL